jgi:hypothetical protein
LNIEHLAGQQRLSVMLLTFCRDNIKIEEKNYKAHEIMPGVL